MVNQCKSSIDVRFFAMRQALRGILGISPRIEVATMESLQVPWPVWRTWRNLKIPESQGKSMGKSGYIGYDIYIYI
jgi:hypothetical protein